MSLRAMRRALAVVSACAFAAAGTASAQTANRRGIDPNQGESLFEVTLPSKGAAERLPYNADGSVTVTVLGTDFALAALDLAGYDLGRTIEGPDTWRARIAERQQEDREPR
jgi:hypothetical protein